MADLAYPLEAERLRALASYELLDTPPEPDFDRLTALAADLFQMPIALVSLVDADRVWHKSMYGYGLVETPRAGAFCASTILTDRPLVVLDATKDERFADSFFVEGESHIRFYAGAPLITSQGQNLGSLCVMDKVPRTFGPAEVSRLICLAAVVMAAIEARLTEHQLRREMAHNAETTKALRHVEARYRRIVENTPGMVYQFVRHADGTPEFLVVSDGCRKVLQLEPEVLLRDATAYLKLIHPEDEPSRQRAIAGALATMEPVFWEGRYILASGQTRWLQASTQPERAANGDVFWDGVIVDVTEHKHTETRLRMLESSVEHATDAVVITEALPLDEPGPRIIYVNEAFTAMSGYSAAEVLGRSPRMFQGSKSDPATKQTIREALEGFKPVQAELINYRKDGSEFWVELNIVPVSDAQGHWTHWVSLQRDTTERRAAQRALEAARDEAERANHAKSEFLSRMSHELRTPLNAILGFGQLLEMSTLTQRQHDNVSQILRGGRHLLELINEVLDIARIEAGKLELALEPVSVTQALGASVALLRPAAAQRDVRLELLDVPALAAVHADQPRLQQVLLNLLSNAVKYNRRNGSVRVSCEPGREGSWCLAVQDTGPGIAAQDLPRLFQPFERLGLKTGDAEGTGIGLAITKRLVEAMGGNVSVESTPGVGSIFRVELPCAPVALPPVQQDVNQLCLASGVNHHVATVLCVEDNISNYTLIELIFEKRDDIRLLGAMQGRIGLELAREHRPDLILLDLQLPDFNGDELLAQLKADERTRHIPVIMISADATAVQINRLKNLGARDYLTKPFNVATFLRTVEDALRPDFFECEAGR